MTTTRCRQHRPWQARGSQHGRARLEEDTVAAMRELRDAGATFAEITRIYGVAHCSTIRRAIIGETWRHVA
jgi:hypothetical protein